MNSATTPPRGLLRWGAVGGFIYFLATFWLALPVGDFPQNATGEELAAFYRSNEFLYYFLPYFLVAIAVVSLVVMATAIRSVLIDAEGQPGHLTTLFYSTVMVFALAQLFANAAFLAAVDTAIFSQNPNSQLTPAIDETVANAGGLGVAGAQFLLSVGLVALAMVVIRTHALSRWFAWASIVLAALALLVVPIFIGYLAPPLWALAAAIALLTRPNQKVSTTAA
jgi:hypothetical protein